MPGSAAPCSDWLAMCCSVVSVCREVISDAGPLEQLLTEHVSGAWNHGDRIWSLLFLEMWHRQYIDSSEPPTEPLSWDLVESTGSKG